jgi:hypothetical protein
MSDQLPDTKLRGKAFASVEDIKDLGTEMRDHGVSEETRMLLARLASYPPPIRLTVNLKTILGLMINGPITSILGEGLLPDERKALIELDLCGLSSKAREVAHGLLNIHERWCAMREFRRMYRAALQSADSFVQPHVEEPNEPEQ